MCFSCALLCSSLKTNPWGKWSHSYPHFTEQESEPQKKEAPDSSKVRRPVWTRQIPGSPHLPGGVVMVIPLLKYHLSRGFPDHLPKSPLHHPLPQADFYYLTSYFIYLTLICACHVLRTLLTGIHLKMTSLNICILYEYISICYSKYIYFFVCLDLPPDWTPPNYIHIFI